MALGKGRHSKRSSSTSYTSTITTVVVIALCVLGVWMLTSDSIASPQSTTRTSAPCLDNEEAIKKLRSRKHFEHRERHCPVEPPTCLVPLPEGYKTPVPWPQRRDKIWFHNVPHKELAEVKGHQNWVKLTGEFLTFPGGGTQFIHGALHYIDFIQKAVPAIAWGRHTRVILDVGCGVASFGGYLFERDVLAISLAPKDEHEAQVQFALERGIPAISAVMGSQRLPFPSNIFDVVQCRRKTSSGIKSVTSTWRLLRLVSYTCLP